MERTVRINPADIPESVYQAGCRILDKSIRAFFKDPLHRAVYEEWEKTVDGQRANLSKNEREKFDAEQIQKRGGKSISCIICGVPIHGYGNSAEPVAHGECCNVCNLKIVVPARIKQIYGSQNERSKQNETRKNTTGTRR